MCLCEWLSFLCGSAKVSLCLHDSWERLQKSPSTLSAEQAGIENEWIDILFYNHTFSLTILSQQRSGNKSFPAALPGAHLSVEAASRLQEQRQVGLDLAAVGVGAVLGLTLQGGDLVLKGMIPAVRRQQTVSKPASRPQLNNFIKL